MTTTLRIAEVASRSGFSPPTLRYYETIGLLPPAERSDNGYRVYRPETLDRLAFIARAKQLGCSLEEIAELNAAWEGGRCAPVQERLGTSVAAKIDDAQARIAELTALVADLRRSAAVLAAHTPEGPCDDRCGCLTDPPAPSTPSEEKHMIPVACTLGASDLDRRLDDWRDLLAHVVDRTPVDGGLRLTFGPDTSAEKIAALAAAEQGCCAFFDFTLRFTADHPGPALEVRAPADAQVVLHRLFGEPAQA